VTTDDFLPQFQRQEHDLLEQIDLGRAAGRPHWVDKNEKKLRAVQAIIGALEGDEPAAGSVDAADSRPPESGPARHTLPACP